MTSASRLARRYQSVASKKRGRLRRALRAGVEALETRLVLSNITWTGGTGDWSDAADWSGGVVPGIEDDVTIPAGGNVTISTGEVSAGSITTAAGSTLTVELGAIFAQGGGTISGGFDLAGSLTNGGEGDPLVFAGTTTVTGTFYGPDTSNTGSLTFQAAVLEGNTFTNTGTVTISDGITLVGGATIMNAPSGLVNVTDDTGFSPNNLGGNGTFINEGTFNQTGGTGVDYYPNVPAGDAYGEFENIGGTINIESGSFTVRVTAALQGGQINVATGSTFSIDAGTTTANYNAFLSGTLTGSGGGTVYFGSDYFNPDMADETQTNATLDFPQGMLQIGDATIYNDEYEIYNAGYVNFVGSAGHGVIYMINDGTIINTGSSNLPFEDVVNDPTGTIDFDTDAGLAYVTANATGLTNEGVIEKTGGTGTSVIGSTFFNDGGSLDIDTGSISFQQDNFGYIAGPIYIATGSTLNFDTSGGIYVQGTLSSTGGGSVTVTSGWLDGPNDDFGENENGTAALDFAPGVLTFAGGYLEDDNGPNFVNTGTINFAASGGPLGAMYNSGTINFAGGQFDVEKGTGINNLPGGVINFNAAVSLVTEAINCRIDNQGVIVVNAGSSTMDLATPYPYDQYTDAPAITNEGSFVVASGTLIFPSVSLTSNGAIPAGASYTVDAGATLTTEVTTSVTTNDGSVILQGLGAQFPALAPLTTNNGTLEVLSGAVFSTAGALTNTGTLSVGGSLTVNGSFTQSEISSTPPVLDFPVATAPDSNAAPDFKVTGSTTLAGNLTAEYSNGFAAGSGTAYTVASFSSPVTGAFASTAGVGPDFTAAVNPTSIELNSTGYGAAQLDVTSVMAPATFTPGQSGTITWKVTNTAAATPDSWTDSVYLSTSGTVNAGDLLLGRVTHTGGLAAGASYTGSLTATLPPAAGTYQVVVLADSGEAVPQTSRTNDVGVSSSIVSSLPALTLGGQVTGTISANEDLLYTLVIPGGTDVRVSATLAAPAVADILISRGAVPSSASADYSLPASTTSDTLATTLPQPQPGTYYILLQGQSAAGSGQTFTLNAASVSYGAFSVSPSTVGAGQVSLVIDGAGFTAASTVALVGSGGKVVATATSTSAPNANTLLSACNLTGVLAGTYSLKITTGSSTTTLTNALAVQPATATLAPVQFSLDAPSVTRYGHIYDLMVQYTNPNNVDVPAPVLELSQPNAEFELVSGNVGANINPDTTFSDGAIELIAADQEGFAGILPPNYSGEYGVLFTAINNIPDSSLDITLSTVAAGATYDLSSLIQPGPDGVSQLTAEILDAQINGLSALPTDPSIGPSAYDANPDLTVSATALDTYLDAIATELSTGGLYIPNVTRLISTAVNAADDFGAVTQYQTAGAFGQGIPDPLLFEVVVPATGLYDVITPSGTEAFQETGSTFTAVNPLDTDTLSTLANGTLRLTQTDGSFYQFNAGDHLAYYQTAGGLQTAFNYGADAEVTSIVAPGNVTTSYTYNSSGLVTTSTDQFGNVTTYGYTIEGSAALLTSITTPAGTTTIGYTPTPSLQTENGVSYYTSSPALEYLPTSIELPDGSGEKFTYDGFGRLTKTTVLDGSDPLTQSYDATGLRVTTTFADGTSDTELLGPDGVPLQTSDANGATTSFSYGPNLLLAALVTPGGASSSISYSGQNEISSATSAASASVSLTYDSDGRVIGVTSGNGDTVMESYNSASELSAMVFPDGTQTLYAYNSAGEIDQITGRDGAVTSYTLNANGQITQVSYSDGTAFSYSYDSQGEMVSSTDADGTTTYTYNAAQEMTGITYPGGQSVSYQYNSKGLVTQESDQSGILETYGYDADARLSEVLNGSGDVLVSYTYDDLGRVSMETFENGTKTIYSYDSNGDIASITNLAMNGTVSSSLAYTYNTLGDPLTATDQSGNVTSYQYDLSGQLTEVTLPGGRTIEYSYDADGNRTSVVDSAGTESATYAVNSLDEYTAVGSTTYTYNEDGDVATMTNGSGITTYTYAPDGQLASSTGPAGAFTYSYNALGQLNSYTINGTRTNLLLDGDGNVIAAYNAAGQLIANYQYGLGLVSAQAPGGSSSFYQFDVTGNTTAITSSSGVVVNTYSYLPFGELLSTTGAPGNLFTYNGSAGVLNLGDGLYQMGQRSYSPAIGRFIQPDPSVYNGGDSNLYRYTFNSPIVNRDPSGLNESGGSPAGPTSPSSSTPVVKPGSQGEQFTPSQENQNEGTADTYFGYAITVIAAAAYTFGGKSENETANETMAQLHESDPINFPFTTQIAQREGYVMAADRGPRAWLRQYNAEHQQQASEYSIDLILATFRFEHWIIREINSTDPNEIVGPAGGGANQYIVASQPLSYTVFFENAPTASAPAQDVTVTTTLDPNVDLATFQLQSIGWGNEVINVPAGLTSYSTRVSYVQPNTGQTILVDVSAALDFNTRTLTWTFTTLDPTTLDSPSDVFAGFLPPENGTGQGTGFVSYTVDPVSGVANGAVISAQASVVFDENPAIATPTWTNTIDTTVPTSSISALPATTTSADFSVSWSGSDTGGSGIASYDVYVSEDGGPFVPFQNDTTATSATFDGQFGHTYSFYSVAVSNAGNVQPTPSAPQASTRLIALPTSAVSTLPSSIGSPSFTVSWSGSAGTGATGIASYDVFVSNDGGPFTPFLTDTTQTSATFTGAYGHSYSFYSVATDNLGDRQPASTTAQATTTVAPLVTMTGVSTVTKKHLVTQIIVSLSGAVNAGEADSLATYRLATAGKKGSFTAKNATVLKLKSAAYNGSNHTVTLTLKKPLNLTKTVQLVVDAEPPAGLEDSYGRLIDGNDDGQPGGNAIALIARGGKVTFDAVRDVVTSARQLHRVEPAAVDLLLRRADLSAASRLLRRD